MREPKEILINGNTLEKILENHKHWLNRDVDGWEYMYADLSGANLRYTDLSGVDLSGTDLNGADLRNADLSDADLNGANLRYANLRGVDLSGTDLNGANLSGANLSDADLNGANLRYADLSGTDLSGANLRYADLIGTDLNKEEQIRKGVKLSNPITGWKKCKNGVIVKLEIPRGAIVFSINNHKCRTDKAIVKEIFGADRAFSMHKYFSYYVGDKIEVYNFNCEYNTECAEGIHFFRTRKEAENYNY